jgi:hypothetical protein
MNKRWIELGSLNLLVHGRASASDLSSVDHERTAPIMSDDPAPARRGQGQPVGEIRADDLFVRKDLTSGLG